MGLKIRYGASVVLAVMVFSLLTPVVLADEAALVMGVFPRKSFKKSIESFLPLAEYLSKKLQRKVVVESGRDFDEFWQGVTQRRYDLVHFNQYHYVRSQIEYGYQVIAKNEEQGRSTMAGSLIVRKDSHFNSVADLRGKKIVFGGGPKAMQSYIVPSFLLQQAGLRPGDYQAFFSRSPANAIYAVYYGQAAAAGSADANLRLPVVQQRIDTSVLKVIAQGEQMAQLPWAVRAEMTTALRESIVSILTSLHENMEGRSVLAKADLTAIRRAMNAEYDPHRHLIETVLGEVYR